MRRRMTSWEQRMHGTGTSTRARLAHPSTDRPCVLSSRRSIAAMVSCALKLVQAWVALTLTSLPFASSFEPANYCSYARYRLLISSQCACACAPTRFVYGAVYSLCSEIIILIDFLSYTGSFTLFKIVKICKVIIKS
jgi:hypothetical protein